MALVAVVVVGCGAVGAEVSGEGVFVKPARVHNPGDEVAAPVGVDDCFIEIAAAAQFRRSVARDAVKE